MLVSRFGFETAPASGPMRQNCKRLRAAFFGALLSTSAFGDEWISPDVERASPSGMVAVDPGGRGTGAVLVIGTQRFFEAEDYPFIAVIDQIGPRYLVGVRPSEPGCDMRFIWVETAGDVRMTEPFGNCGRAFQFGLDAAQPVVVLPRPEGGGFDGYVYDGMQVYQTDLGTSPTGIGVAPEDWLGQPVRDFVRAPEWQHLFLNVIPIEDYLELADQFPANVVMQADRGWIGAAFCQAGACFLDLRSVYIHSSGQGLIVVVGTGLGSRQVWWDAVGLAPPEALENYAP